MVYRATRIGEATDALVEVRARLTSALSAVEQATRLIEERELHVKRALDILARGAETRDLTRQMAELGMPLDDVGTSATAK